MLHSVAIGFKDSVTDSEVTPRAGSSPAARGSRHQSRSSSFQPVRCVHSNARNEDRPWHWCARFWTLFNVTLCVQSIVRVSPEENNNWFSWQTISGTFSVLCANAGFNSGYMLASVHRRRVQDGFFLGDDLVNMLCVQRFCLDSGFTLTCQVFGNESHTFSSCRWTRSLTMASLPLVLQVDLGSCVLCGRAVRTW